MAARRNNPGITTGEGDNGWDDPVVPKSTAEHPTKYPPMASPVPVTSMATLKYADRALYDGIENLLVNLKHDMLPECIQMEIVEAMTPSTQRWLVQKIAGLDASVLMTFKQQLALIDAVTRRVVTPEGVAISGHNLDITVKEALNISMKLIGIMVKDLPKVISLARVQRLEQSLLNVVHSLPKDKQDEVLALLEEEERKAARESK